MVLPEPVVPAILFGAFDRHNFGDLLLGEIARRLVAPLPAVFAGLAGRDMRVYGGERVSATGELASAWGDTPVQVIHVGGELLTCKLYEAAIMLQSDEDARRAIACYDVDERGRHVWAASVLGMDRLIPYQVPRVLFRHPGTFAYLGVGGVDLDHEPAEVRREVIRHLAAADFVWVRDRVTRAHLADAGVEAMLAPDPAELTGVLCAAEVSARAEAGPVQSLRERFPGGYLAAQFSADYGDDATLAMVGAQLQRICREHGLGVVLFRAGAAPWHDRLDVYRRLMQWMSGVDAVVFESLHLWDIAALIAESRGFVGSSLHGRIVAEAFGRPAASLVSGVRRPKCGVYVESWNADAIATVAPPAGLALAFRRACERGANSSDRRNATLPAANAFRRAIGLAPLPPAASIEA